MAHPLIPFVTEDIWSQGHDGLLAESRWPEASPIDEAAEAEIAEVIETVHTVRAWRDAHNVRPSAILPATHEGGQVRTSHILARLARLEWAEGEVAARAGTVGFLASDDVDLEAQTRRVEKRRGEVEAEIQRAEGKLANEKFVANAPEAVVAKERNKLAELRAELDDLVAGTG